MCDMAGISLLLHDPIVRMVRNALSTVSDYVCAFVIRLHMLIYSHVHMRYVMAHQSERHR